MPDGALMKGQGENGNPTLEGSQRGVLGQETPGALVAMAIPDSPVRSLYHNTY